MYIVLIRDFFVVECESSLGRSINLNGWATQINNNNNKINQSVQMNPWDENYNNIRHNEWHIPLFESYIQPPLHQDPTLLAQLLVNPRSL